MAETAQRLDQASAAACPACGGRERRALGEKRGYRIVRCDECGLRFTDPMPGAEDIDGFYDSYMTEKNVRRSRLKVFRNFWRMLPLRARAPGRDFLDIGCNTGFAVEAARRAGFRAVGIDLAVSAIETAPRLYPKCSFHLTTAQDFAAGDQRFDVVFCSEVIEHMNEIASFGAALRTLLRPGGLLYLTTPDAGHEKRPNDFVSWQQVCPPHHLLWFDRPSMTDFLARYGFSVIRFETMRKPSLRLLARRTEVTR